MSHPRLGRKLARRPLLEALEDRRVLSHFAVGSIVAKPDVSAAHAAHVSDETMASVLKTKADHPNKAENSTNAGAALAIRSLKTNMPDALISDGASRGALKSKGQKSTDYGVAATRQQAEKYAVGPARQRDSNGKGPDKASRKTDARIDKSTKGQQEYQTFKARDLGEKRADSRKERQVVKTVSAKKSHEPADEDERLSQEQHAEFVAGSKESRAEFRQANALGRPSKASDDDQASRPMVKSSAQEDEDKNGIAVEESPPIARARGSERVKGPASNPMATDPDVSAQPAELKESLVRSHPANIGRNRAEQGQPAPLPEDRSAALPDVPASQADTLHARPDLPGISGKSESPRLTWDEVGRSVAGGVRGLASVTLGAADGMSASALFATLEEIITPQDTAILVGGDLASGIVTIRTAALDEALRQFSAGADEIASAFTRGLSDYGALPWLLAAAASSVALEMQRRRKRRQAPIANKPSLTADTELRWAPGMPGSFSDEDV